MTVSCGNNEATNNDTTTKSDTDTQTQEEVKFVYEFSQDYAGSEFTVLNAEDIYSMRAEMDREEITGEALDDAMYNRCRTLEEKMGIVFVEENENLYGIAGKAMNLILAGDDTYDAMYITAEDLHQFTSGGYLNDLMQYDAFNFDKEWWHQNYNQANIIDGKLYAAAGSSQLMVIDSLWVLYFNESMMDKLKLEYPYDLVRDGTWTLDRLSEYLKVGAMLNGDDSFVWNENGNCTYGLSSGGPHYFLRGAGEMFVESDNGKLVFTAGSERFYNVVSKIVSVLSVDDGNVFQHIDGDDGVPGSYIYTFESGRAMFLTAEISKTSRMRNIDFSFGIVPNPKYDENKDRYYTTPFCDTPCYTIPVTVSDPVRSAVIGDALSYLSWDMVMPVFREITLEQKGLRNEDSIEMLDIIIDSTVPVLTDNYNVGKEMLARCKMKLQ